MPQQLHHLLAIERQTRNTAETILGETVDLFNKGSQLSGETKEYFPKDEDGKPLPRVDKEVVTTVPDRLAWTWKHFSKLLDFEYRRDAANLKAIASLNFGPEALTSNSAQCDAPATFLLALEKHIEKLIALYNRIPTLDMAKRWTPASREGVFQHGPIKTYRTEKKTVPVVLVAPTDKHPAQVKAETEDVPVGHFDHIVFSGAVHPKDKARWIGKLDELRARVKQARMEANRQEIGAEIKIGEMIRQFVHGRDKA